MAEINPAIFREYDIRGIYGTDLTEDYVELIGARPPSKGFKLNDLFAGCEIRAVVTTVRHLGSDNRKTEAPEDCWYSKIERFIEIVSGLPSCARDFFRP